MLVLSLVRSGAATEQQNFSFKSKSCFNPYFYQPGLSVRTFQCVKHRTLTVTHTCLCVLTFDLSVRLSFLLCLTVQTPQLCFSSLTFKMFKNVWVLFLSFSNQSFVQEYWKFKSDPINIKINMKLNTSCCLCRCKEVMEEFHLGLSVNNYLITVWKKCMKKLSLTSLHADISKAHKCSSCQISSQI